MLKCQEALLRSLKEMKVDFKSSLLPNVVQSVLKEVKKMEENAGGKRGNYAVFSGKDKAKIAKYASENGVEVFQEN